MTCISYAHIVYVHLKIKREEEKCQKLSQSQSFTVNGVVMNGYRGLRMLKHAQTVDPLIGIHPRYKTTISRRRAMKINELKDVSKKLNDLGLEGIEKIRTVGVKQDVMAEKFMIAVESVDDAGLTDQLPEEIINAYNELTATVPPEESEEKSEEESEEVGKKNEKTKSSQKKAAEKGRGKNKGASRSRYGHVQSALSGQLDDLLFAGNTVNAMMDALKIKRTRVINHVKHLKNDKGLTVVETKPEGKDIKLNDTHYQVTEEVWTED